MSYILGIDQGGTKTFAAVMDYNGNILAHGKAAGAYFPRCGVELAMDSIATAVHDALDSTDIKLSDVNQVVAGVTGIDWDKDSDIVSAAIQKRFGIANVHSYNDCVTAMYSGTQKSYGAIICAGTGLNSAIFTPDGKGFVLGDYIKDTLQGGSALAHRAIQAVFDSDLGVLPPTLLKNLFLTFSGEATVYDLLHKYMTDRDFPDKITGLVPQIIDLATQGDQVTTDLLKKFADELCECFVAALKKMEMLDRQYDIVLTGSVFKGRENKLTAYLTQNISHRVRKASIVNAKYEPVVGSCVLGVFNQFDQLTPEQCHNLNRSAHRFQLVREI